VSVQESFPSVSCSQWPIALLTAFTLSGFGVKVQYVGCYCWLKRLGWATKLQWWFTSICGIHNKLLNLRSAGTESLMVYCFTLISPIYAVPSEKRGGVDCSMTQCYFWCRVNVVWTGSMLESKAGNVAQWVSGRERTGLLPGRHATFTRWQASRKTSRASREQLISIFAVSISRFLVYTAWNCEFIWNTSYVTRRGHSVSRAIFLRLHN